MKFIRSLHGRLIIVSGVVIGVSLAFFGYFSSLEEKQRLEDFHVDAFTEHATSIINRFGRAMARGEQDTVRQVLMYEAHDADISDIKLIRHDGQIVISTAGVETLSHLSMPDLDSIFRQETRYAYRRGGLIAIVKPIGNSPRCHRCHPSDKHFLGFLEVDFRFDPSQRGMTGFYSSVAASAVLFIILISTTLWVFQYRFVRRPIARLMDAIQHAKDGDLSVHIGVTGSDEFGRLTANFNDLLARLAKAQEDLKSLHMRQMEHAERLATAGELASGIAHEIKNPLAGISSAIQVLQEGRGEGYPDQEVLAEMAAQIKRIEKAVTDLLSYACPSQPEFKEGDVNDNARRCVGFVTPMAEQQKTMVTIRLDHRIPRFLIDAGLLDQVLINVLMNALQALRHGGTISVVSTFDENDRSAVIMIADDGPGMPEAMKTRIFRPFFTTKHRGSGLGLSISKKNVERHRGTMEVISELGKGLTVLIRLPVDTTFDELHRPSMT
ncbi:MAG TPA: ATP-binding protein [Acidobacteriota bacterium]|nr:ATP-binding protein [Acidobacteriota bacterium]